MRRASDRDKRHDEEPALDPELEPDLDATHRARPTLPHAVVVFVGGSLGVFARDALVRATTTTANSVPWMLLGINVLGAAVLGFVVANVLDPRPHAISLRLLLATGLLGGFTTYSSLVSAAIVAGHDHRVGNALVIIVGTSIVGVAVAAVASRLRTATPS